MGKRVVITKMPSKKMLEDFLRGMEGGPVTVVFHRKSGRFVRLKKRQRRLPKGIIAP